MILCWELDWAFFPTIRQIMKENLPSSFCLFQPLEAQPITHGFDGLWRFFFPTVLWLGFCLVPQCGNGLPLYMLSPGWIPRAGASEHRKGERMTWSLPVLLSGEPVTFRVKRSSVLLSCRVSRNLGLCPVSPVIVRTRKAPTYFQKAPGGVILAPIENHCSHCAVLKRLQKPSLS